MYYQCYDLLVQYIFGAPEILTPYQELVATQLATFFSVLAVSLPVLAVVVIFFLIVRAVVR